MTAPPTAGNLAEAQTFLFVPATRADRYDKAINSGADVVIIDLEDAVGPAEKEVARDLAASWLARGGRAAVRVNGVGTPWFADDVRAVKDATAIVLPKTESTVDITAVTGLVGPETAVIPLVETALGILAVVDICAASTVVRAGFGNIDFAADLGVNPTSRSALAWARSQLVVASRATGRAAPIEGVTTRVGDIDALVDDTVYARDLGFGAKLLIHPAQVDPVVEAFRPSAKDVSWANAVLSTATGGVGLNDGQMIDEPVLIRARQILSRSQATD